MYGSESSSDGGWISWFIELEGHEFFVEVSISKHINGETTGLKNTVNFPLFELICTG